MLPWLASHSGLSGQHKLDSMGCGKSSRDWGVDGVVRVIREGLQINKIKICYLKVSKLIQNVTLKKEVGPRRKESGHQEYPLQGARGPLLHSLSHILLIRLGKCFCSAPHFCRVMLPCQGPQRNGAKFSWARIHETMSRNNAFYFYKLTS